MNGEVSDENGFGTFHNSHFSLLLCCIFESGPKWARIGQKVEINRKVKVEFNALQNFPFTLTAVHTEMDL